MGLSDLQAALLIASPFFIFFLISICIEWNVWREDRKARLEQDALKNERDKWLKLNTSMHEQGSEWIRYQLDFSVHCPVQSKSTPGEWYLMNLDCFRVGLPFSQLYTAPKLIEDIPINRRTPGYDVFQKGAQASYRVCFWVRKEAHEELRVRFPFFRQGEMKLVGYCAKNLEYLRVYYRDFDGERYSYLETTLCCKEAVGKIAITIVSGIPSELQNSQTSNLELIER